VLGAETANFNLRVRSPVNIETSDVFNVDDCNNLEQGRFYSVADDLVVPQVVCSIWLTCICLFILRVLNKHLSLQLGLFAFEPVEVGIKLPGVPGFLENYQIAIEHTQNDTILYYTSLFPHERSWQWLEPISGIELFDRFGHLGRDFFLPELWADQRIFLQSNEDQFYFADLLIGHLWVYLFNQKLQLVLHELVLVREVKGHVL
jgi:hypothetical protein